MSDAPKDFHQEIRNQDANQNIVLHQNWLSRLFSQFKRFIGVGLIAACVHYALLIISVEMRFLTPVFGALLGYIGGGVVSYILNRTFTFNQGSPVARSMMRFAIVACVGFIITYIMMYWLNTLNKVPYIFAQVITTGVVLFWSFIAHKWWTFRKSDVPTENVATTLDKPQSLEER